MKKAFSKVLDDFVNADQKRTDWKALDLHCIDCDLEVFHRNAGGNQPAKFVHRQKCLIMKVCALRSASTVSKSPFNLILTKSDTVFHLYVNIRALPDRIDVPLNKTVGIISGRNKYALSQFSDGDKILLSKIPLESDAKLIHDRSEEIYNLTSV